jgi:phosphatidylglycerol lysyltransferase
VRAVPPSELAGALLRRSLDELIERWLATRAAAPLGFLLQVEPYSFPEERLCFVAECGGRVVGFLGVIPVYARGGWFLEDFVRDPDAPNGTVELLIDAGMRAAAAAGVGYVTLGLAPLAGELPRWLQLARSCSRPLYDFEGLRRFKAKLAPARWDPIYISYPQRGTGALALLDALNAFARGKLLRYGAETLRGRLARALATSPVPSAAPRA